MSRKGILFDLDGTLADTAPDLVAVLNTLLEQAGRPPVPYAIARNEVSNGALGLIRLGFGLRRDAEVEAGLRQEFLQTYVRMGHGKSLLFMQLREIHELVSSMNAVWGVVTNKPESLTLSLLEALGVLSSAGVVVSGDTLPERKPHPAPLIFAAAQLGVDCERCVYLGDAARDIDAGRAAGMRTIVTSYGYIRPSEDIGTWGADAIAAHPRRIQPMLLATFGAR